MNPAAGLDEASATAHRPEAATATSLSPWGRRPDDAGSSAMYLRALRQWWWLPLATGLICGATALGLTSRETPRYLATATSIVAPTSEMEASSDVLRSLDTLERRTVVATFARIASTREVRDAAAARLGIGSGEVRGHRISASVISSTNLIVIRAEGPNPELVASLANAAALVTEAEARRLYRIFTLHPVEAATAPTRPVHPDPQRNAGVGLVLGLFVGILGALAIEGVRSGAYLERGVARAA